MSIPARPALSARLTLDPSFSISSVNRRLFGSFVEHMGRCVYTGIYEPGHPAADSDGFRTDVLALVRELGVTTIRYPGGNFVSGYRWEDGVGPAESRPRRLDLAWHSIETNEFGLHEFMRWTEKAAVEPMMAVNLGTRGIQEAVDLLEYSSVDSGTTLAQQRIDNGAKEPFRVRMWCLGNEMDGPWQLGHKTAAEYGRLAAETARAMRLVDPGLELVVCGSSSADMPTFGRWEAEVLEATYEQVDYISCHAYFEQRDDDLESFLASGVEMDHFLGSVIAAADHVGARLKSGKKLNLSVDEWNVWYLTRYQNLPTAEEWTVAPRIIEDCYNVADAVVVGGLLISLLRHSDRVAAASLAQLVNVIAPIMTEPAGPAWRQTIFHPFAQTARYARGRVLRVEPQSPTVLTGRHGEVPAVDAVATYDSETRASATFLVNRSPSAQVSVDIRCHLPGEPRLAEAVTICGPDLHATNDRLNPDRVHPRPLDDVQLSGDMISATLPPASWTMLRLSHG
jgi:alpha-L-arabinofuranosidase